MASRSFSRRKELYLPAESQFMHSHVMATELYSPDCFMGSCILNTLMVECWLTLNQHPDLYLVDTRSTLDEHSVANWPTVNWLISMNRKLVDFRSTVDQGDNECQLSVRWGIDRVSIKSQSSSIKSRSTLDCRCLCCTHDPLYLQYSLYS